MVYDAAQSEDLEHLVGPARLRPYLTACSEDLGKAQRLYLWNVELSSAFWGPISLVEVALRNRIQEALGEIRITSLDFNEMLDAGGKKTLKRAVDILDRRGVDTPSDDMVVAELSFGFWVSLFNVNRSQPRSRNYETLLWRPYLHRAFPHRAENERVQVHRSLDRIRKLRNRIAHNEPIWGRDTAADIEQIISVSSWMSLDLSALITTTHRVDEVLARREEAVERGACSL